MQLNEVKKILDQVEFLNQENKEGQEKHNFNNSYKYTGLSNGLEIHYTITDYKSLPATLTIAVGVNNHFAMSECYIADLAKISTDDNSIVILAHSHLCEKVFTPISFIKF